MDWKSLLDGVASSVSICLFNNVGLLGFGKETNLTHISNRENTHFTSSAVLSRTAHYAALVWYYERLQVVEYLVVVVMD